MTKTSKKDMLTVMEAERAISELLRPWLCRNIRRKRRITFVERKATFFEEDPMRAMGPVRNQLFHRMNAEARQLHEEHATEQKRFPFFIERISIALKRTNATRIQKIKIVSMAFLKEYRRVLSEIFEWCESDWMSEDELEELSKLAVFAFLEYWLDNDRKSYLIIESFTKYGYGNANDGEVYENKYENRKARLSEAYDKYENAYRKQQELRSEHSLTTAPVPYKRDNKRKLSLITLAWCEAWSEYDLELLRMLFFKKTLANRKSEHDSRQNEKLRTELNTYAQFVDRIANSYPADGDSVSKYKAYVANCCMIQRLERSYHFSLAGHMANYAAEHGCKPTAYDKERLCEYIGDYQDEEWILILSNRLLNENKERIYNHRFVPLRTLGYDKIVEEIFVEPESKQANCLNKELLQRTATDNLLHLMAVCFPCDKWSWTEDDFLEAAAFLKDEYRFLARLTTWFFPEPRGKQMLSEDQRKKETDREQKFLDYYYALFLELYNDEETHTRWIINSLSQNSKRKGRRSSKS